METILTEREETRQKAERTAAIYVNMFVEILQGKNLDKHLPDITKAIVVVDNQLIEMKAAGERTDSIEELKNNLYRLKWMILERN